MAFRLSRPVLNIRNRYNDLGMIGNLGQGRHYDPTKHMTLEEMKRKSIFYNDVYLDGLVMGHIQ